MKLLIDYSVYQSYQSLYTAGALCELAQSIDCTINGTMDSYLHAVSGVSSCLAVKPSRIQRGAWKLRRARNDHTPHNQKRRYRDRKNPTRQNLARTQTKGKVLRERAVAISGKDREL
jgi:hypothetical protein